MNNNGPGLVIYDETGNHRLYLGVGKNRPAGMVLYDETGNHRIVLGVGKDRKDSPTLGIYDEEGKRMLLLP